MPLGISFGTNKTKTNQTDVVDKTEQTNQSQTGTTASSGVTSNTGSTTQTGSSTGSQTQTQIGSTSQTGQQVGQTSSLSQLFSDQTLSGLEGAVGHLLGNVGAPLTHVGSFDPSAFIDQGLTAAKNLQGQSLEDSVNQLTNSIGGTAGSNSAVALLSNRLHGDAAANLAGITGQLTGQAQEIERNNALAGNTIDTTHNQLLAGLLEALKGGAATTTGSEAQQTSQTGATTQSGATATSEQTQQGQQSESTQTQDLIQILSQLLSGTVHTTGTDTQTGTQSKVGGGFSLSL